MKKLCGILVLFLLFAELSAQAQTDSVAFQPQYRKGLRYHLRTSTGSNYEGFVTAENAKYVTIEDRQNLEKWELLKSGIVSARVLTQRENVETAFGENYHFRNYLLSATAFPFEEGNATSQSHWFIFENTDYSITDNWGLSVNSLAFYPFSFGLKCAYEVGEYNYIGLSGFGIANINPGYGNFFLGYGGVARFTRGTENRNFTLSGGVLGLNSSFFAQVSRLDYVNIGFMSFALCNRFAPRAAFNIEGWYLPEVMSGIAGAGIKFMEDDRTCWNFGCFAFFNNYGTSVRIQARTLPIPYFGLTRKFN